jgi:hypothetical protein
VNFWFQLQDKDDDPDGLDYPVAFEINYYRPSYFIREAEPELAAIVRRFDWVVLDPQIGGMGEGEYQGDLLVSGWNIGNEYAVAGLPGKPQTHGDAAFFPTKTLTRIWEWNRGRTKLQEQVGQAQFVPSIKFCRFEGRVITLAIWPEAFPAVLPKVDYLYVAREEFAPRRFSRQVPDVALVAWDEALPVLARHASRRDGDTVSLSYSHRPRGMIDFIQSLPTETRQIVAVAADKILDRELVEKYRV